MKDILLAGFALMLVFEGLMPLLAPRAWRAMVTGIAQFKDGQIRFVGLASIVAGFATLMFLK